MLVPPSPQLPGPVGTRIGSIRGIEIRAHFSWFLFVVAVVVLSGISATRNEALGTLSPWAALPFGIATALVIFGSIFLHELAHAMAATRVRVPVRRVVLVMFLGLIDFVRPPRTAREELAIYGAGPVMSGLLSVVGFTFVFLVTVAGAPPWLVRLGLDLAILNILLLVVNLLPAVPMDGSRVYRGARWLLTGDLLGATREAALAGRLAAVSLGALGIFLLLLGQWLGVLLIPFGWLAYRHAGAFEREAEVQALFSGVKAADLMRPIEAAIPAHASLSEAMEIFHRLPPGTDLPVVEDERVLGWVTPLLWADTEPRQWDWINVRDYIRPYGERPTVRPEDDGATAFLATFAFPGGTAPVFTADGVLVGILRREDAEAWIALRRSAGI